MCADAFTLHGDEWLLLACLLVLGLFFDITLKIEFVEIYAIRVLKFEGLGVKGKRKKKTSQS